MAAEGKTEEILRATPTLGRRLTSSDARLRRLFARRRKGRFSDSWLSKICTGARRTKKTKRTFPGFVLLASVKIANRFKFVHSSSSVSTSCEWRAHTSSRNRRRATISYNRRNDTAGTANPEPSVRAHTEQPANSDVQGVTCNKQRATRVATPSRKLNSWTLNSNLGTLNPET